MTPRLHANKREPGTGCSAIKGLNRGNAILGNQATPASQPIPPTCAWRWRRLDARVRVAGPAGERSMALHGLSLACPGDTPQRGYQPWRRTRSWRRSSCTAQGFASNYTYLKIRRSPVLCLCGLVVGRGWGWEMDQRRIRRGAASR